MQSSNLIVRELKPSKYFVKMELLNGHLPGLTEGHVPQQNVGAKGESIHVLSGSGKHFA